jgi:type II secretory pathway component GspD/PulD (secretin)
VLKVPFEKKRSVFILSLCYSLASNALLIALPVAAEQLIANKQMNVLDGKVVKNNPVGGAKIEQDTIKVETTTPSASVAISEPDVSLPNKQPKIVVSPENTTGKEAALLERIKEQKQLENNLKLVPTERKVNDAVVKSAKRNVKSLPENTIINKLEFNQANMLDVARALADISGLNFVATEEASKKNVTVFLQNISVISALEAITKNSGLWYRKDKDSGTFRIMSTEEYQRDLVVYREDTTRVFNLLHPNPVNVATAVRDLYGDRVILSYGSDYDDFNTGAFNGSSSNGSSNQRNNGGNSATGAPSGAGLSNGQSSLRRTITTGNTQTNNRLGITTNRNNNAVIDEKVTGTSGNGAITEKFTVDQLAKLEKAVEFDENGNLISADVIRGISRAQQPIYITVIRQQNMMILRTSDSIAVKEIESLVKEMDKPTPQVLLEMKILEVDVGDAYNQIFTFDALSNNGKHRAFARDDDEVSGTGKFVYRFLDDLIFLQLELLEKNNKANTVSSPVLLASNNRTARLFVGEERLLVRGATLTDPVVNANGITVTPAKITYETEIRNVGNTLNITPKINADGTVTLGIFQDTSSVNENAVDFPPLITNGTVVNISLDTVNTANIEGVVVAKDGLTVAIGGLIRNTVSKEESKVPVLGDIPVIGNVFKDKIESASRKELILLITPHIITAPSESDDVTRDTIEPLTDQNW